MELNSKKLERTSRLIYYSISFILCLFLILLSNRIIDDLDRTVDRPEPAHYENRELLASFEKQRKQNVVVIEELNFKKNTIAKTIATARENYRNEKQSFDNWVETRKTLGSPDKDQEVTARAKKLDDYYAIEQDWRSQLNLVQSQIDEKVKRNQEIDRLIEKERQLAEKKYLTEYGWYELKVFLIRLLFVAPVLALGIFFFIRFRKNKFWPLYFGFTLFSLYTFFFGLVPYLPGYGGYVRYTVGIALSIGLGYYAIKKIRLYLEQKQAELKISTEERAKKVHSETAEKALDNHFCPSCGKDFIIKRWDLTAKGSETDMYRMVTNFCRHCGLELFKNCENCGTRNFAHLPFCSSCGTKIQK